MTKPHAGPIVGELIQVGGGIMIATCVIGLALTHHWPAVAAMIVGVTAYFIGRHFRQKLY